MSRHPYEGVAQRKVPKETVHCCPKGDLPFTPCCWKSPLELPVKDRITTDPEKVTCGKEHL